MFLGPPWERFTPTHVGNTKIPGINRVRGTVHPHARGEYGGATGSGWNAHGSPPRTWGIRTGPQPETLAERFTPTHVGNTMASCVAARRFTVHPHARGEYFQADSRPVGKRGSPPRTWGIHAQLGGDLYLPRFTPTHVGNTSTPLPPRPENAVHPHARGEYEAWLLAAADTAGSPPLTWGILGGPSRCCGAARFTPTHVGNTGPQCERDRLVPVHPHARGEYKDAPLPHDARPGSPPRTWGILVNLLRIAIHHRFTPTHVGNTRCRTVVQGASPVHPHARGEYSFVGCEIDPGYGSPPRTWGILILPDAGDGRLRFTPTHVGNTALLDAQRRHEFGSPPRTWGIP